MEEDYFAASTMTISQQVDRLNRSKAVAGGDMRVMALYAARRRCTL
jgi:hypothetical protein